MAAVEYIGRKATFWTVGRLRLAGLVAVLGAWELAGLSGLFFSDVLPSAFRIVRAMGQLLISREFYNHLWVTVFEVLVSFVLGAVTGTLAGLALGISRRAGDIFEPFIHYLAPTPKIVFLPILLVLFGVGMGSKIALGAISCFFPMALNIAAGVREVSPTLLRVGRTFNLTRSQTIRMIYLPALIPAVATGFRIGLAVSIVGCLLSEYKLARAGMGFLAGQYGDKFAIAHMLAVLIFIFVLASLGNAVIARFVRLPGPGDPSRGKTAFDK